MNSLVYLCYGGGAYISETLFSLLTAFRFDPPGNSDFQYVVYTDTPQSFNIEGVKVIQLDDETINKWKGAHGYTHRIKTASYISILDDFPGAVAMIDTDTYFRRAPSLLFRRISPKNSLMHVPETRLLESGRAPDAMLHEIVHSRSYTDLEGKRISFEKSEVMWNSGVIGAHSSNIDLFKEALNLIDQMSGHTKAPVVHHIEQFAVGYFLNRTRLRPCSDVIYHYWYEYLKVPFRNRLPVLLSSVAERPIQERAELVWKEKPTADARRRVNMAIRITLRTLGFRVRGWRASA